MPGTHVFNNFQGMEVQAARLAGNLNSPPWRGVRRREDSNQLREEDDRRQPREDDINSETTTQHMVGLSHLVIFYFFVFSIQNTDYLQTVPALLHFISVCTHCNEISIHIRHQLGTPCIKKALHFRYLSSNIIPPLCLNSKRISNV